MRETRTFPVNKNYKETVLCYKGEVEMFEVYNQERNLGEFNTPRTH